MKHFSLCVELINKHIVTSKSKSLFFLDNTKLIEFIMGLRPRQGNLRFSDFSNLIRGFAEDET